MESQNKNKQPMWDRENVHKVLKIFRKLTLKFEMTENIFDTNLSDNLMTATNISNRAVAKSFVRLRLDYLQLFINFYSNNFLTVNCESLHLFYEFSAITKGLGVQAKRSDYVVYFCTILNLIHLSEQIVNRESGETSQMYIQSLCGHCRRPRGNLFLIHKEVLEPLAAEHHVSVARLTLVLGLSAPCQSPPQSGRHEPTVSTENNL